jgi:hypothetical protein
MSEHPAAVGGWNRRQEEQDDVSHIWMLKDIFN